VATALGLAGLLMHLGLGVMVNDRMALTSAVMLTSGGGAILLAAVLRQAAAQDLAIGIAGFVLVALAGTFVIARIAGVIDPMADAIVAGASLQTLLAGFLLGTWFLLLIWSRGLVGSAPWLPAAVGTASIVTVLILWRALSVKESEQVVTLARQAGMAERATLIRDFEVTARSLRRAADWRMHGATPEQQEADLLALRRDVPGLEYGLWLPLGDTARAAPFIPGLDSVWHEYTHRTGTVPDSLAFLPLDLTARRFVIVAPGCGEGPCAGAMVGVVRAAKAFESAFADTAQGFHFGIESGRTPYEYSPRPSNADAPWAQSLAMDVGEVHMSLATWPTRGTLTQVRSNLPELVVVMGLIVSGLLPLAMHLGQRARLSAREIERARLASALERATDGLWEWDLVSNVSVRSVALWHYLGYDPNHVPTELGAWTALIHPDDAAGVTQALERHLVGETPSFEAEYRIHSQDGTWHTIIDRGRVVERTTTGRPMRVLGISADVTETRTAEAAREATERRFRAIFDTSFQSKLLLDREGAVIEVNQVALSGLGASEAEVRGRPVWETLWWARDPAAAARLQQAVASALTGVAGRYEQELPQPGGALLILEIAVKPIPGVAGETSQLLLEARDITERRRTEAALQEVDTLTTMGRVAARVAHEINNPLAGIQNSFLLIKGAVPPTHPHFAYVGAIEREIARIAAVTRQLYETYRPEQDGSGETSLRTVLGDAIAFLEQVNRSAKVKVATEYRNIPTVIPLPAAMLRQIAYNLIQNSIEVCPPGSTVHVCAAIENGDLRIRVRDNGPGVPPELRERIFEPFFSTKDKRMRTSGMGLGLALVRRTVTAAGGTITVGDAEGGGSEFVVCVPLRTLEHGV
jgi:PAS domain S-box-containing protein